MRAAAAVALVGLLALGACSVPVDTVSAPLPVAIMYDATIHDDTDPSARCVVGITITGLGVVTAVGTAGLVASLSWGAVWFGAGMTAEQCLRDAAETVYQPFVVWFTCDGSNRWAMTFQRFVEVARYMEQVQCFTSGGGGGGGGGGGAGW